jgi:uncharacterized membrane protein
MALDHANYLIAQQHTTGEYWGGPAPVYETPLHFLTRFVTHLSAPGFFFLMGIGMVLFLDSRHRKGWGEKEIKIHFLLRGLILMQFQLIINLSQVWSVGGSPAPHWYGGVLYALGAGMILCIPAMELKPAALALGSGLFFIILEILTPDPVMWGRNFDNLAGILLVYSGGQRDLWINYPVLAWVEVILFGMLFGKIMLLDKTKAYRTSGWIGLAFLAGFIGLRMLNGFGNIRPQLAGSWTDYLSIVKYPPSMTFIFITMGINLLLLWSFSKMECVNLKEWHPLLVFGRVPLFSYLGHLGIYFVLGKLLAPAGSSLGVMYLLWLAGLGILYFPARWFGRYKSQQSSRSWVRFL